MKKIIILLCLGVSLSACKYTQQAVEDFVTDLVIGSNKQVAVRALAAQVEKINILYRALQSKDTAILKPLLDTSLQQQIKQSPELMQHTFQLIPSGNVFHRQVFTTVQSKIRPTGKVTSVVMLFEYPQAVIALTVVFKGGEGETTVLAFTVDQFDQSDMLNTANAS